MMIVGVGWDGFDGKRYLNLETYRGSGVGVRTPVWFAAEPLEDVGPKLYVYSTADSGKAKRVRRSGVVKIAPCDARGTVTGAWIVARAQIVGAEEFGRGMRLLNRNYWTWKQILGLSALLFPGRQRVVIAIRPA
jgi:PPOX class probable F420-dependent enzyme